MSASAPIVGAGATHAGARALTLRPHGRVLVGSTMDDVGCAPGPSVAGGLFRNGILPTPVVAEDVALSVLGRQGSVDLSPFAPTRASRA